MTLWNCAVMRDWSLEVMVPLVLPKGVPEVRFVLGLPTIQHFRAAFLPSIR
jgi:hypothetical protein